MAYLGKVIIAALAIIIGMAIVEAQTLKEQNLRKDSVLFPVYQAAQSFEKSRTELKKVLYQDNPEQEPNKQLLADLGSMMGTLAAHFAWGRGDDQSYVSYVRQLQDSVGKSLDYATKHSAGPAVIQAVKNAHKDATLLASLVGGLQKQSYPKNRVAEVLTLGKRK